MNELTLKGLRIWLICAFFFTYEFLLRTVVGTFEEAIIHDLQLTTFGFSFISSTAYLLTYGLMQLPVGIIAANHGLKKALLFATVLCTLSSVGFALSSNLYVAIFFRIAMGLGSSFGFVCLAISVFEWLPNKRVGLFIGVSQFIGTLGPMLAAGPMASLAAHDWVTWRDVFFVLAAVGMVMTFLVLVYVENNHQTIHKFTILKPRQDNWHHLTLLVKEKQIWYIALFSAFSYFLIEYLSENEGTLFLQKNHFSKQFSSYMITLSWLSYAICCPLIGYFSDLIKRRKLPIIFCSFCGLIASVGIIYFPVNKLALMVFFVLLGLGASGQTVGFATNAEQCRTKYQNLGIAFNNFSLAFISAVNAPLIALFLSYSHQVGQPLPLSAYHQGFFLIVLINVVSVILTLFFIQETYCKKTKENTRLRIR